MAPNNAFTVTMLTLFSSLRSYGINGLPITITLALGIGLLLLLGRLRCKNEGHTKGTEPPEVKSRIPLFGHLIGMLRGQVGYFQTVRYENRASLNTARADCQQLYCSAPRFPHEMIYPLRSLHLQQSPSAPKIRYIRSLRSRYSPRVHGYLCYLRTFPNSSRISKYESFRLHHLRC